MIQTRIAGVVFASMLVVWVTAVDAGEHDASPDVARVEALETELRRLEAEYGDAIRALRSKLDAVTGYGSAASGNDGSGAPQEDRLTALEEEVGFLQEDQISLLESIARRTQVDLYATLEYENFADRNSVFDARNIELLVNAELSSRLRARAEIEFERTAITSGSSHRTGEVEVEQGWLEFAFHRALRARFGVLLVPFGKFNLEHFDTHRDLTDRPIVMRRVIPVTWAEAGLGLVGEFEVGAAGDKRTSTGVEYAVYLVNGLTDHMSDTSMRGARGGFGSDNNDNKALVGRIAVSPQPDLMLGFSSYLGKWDRADDKAIRGVALDAQYAPGPFDFLVEIAEFNVDDGVLADGLTPAPSRFFGYYAQAAYHFWPDALNKTALGRDFSAPVLTGVVRYGKADIDDDGDAGTGDNREDRWTIGLNYRPMETFVFKLEYQINETTNESLERGNDNGLVFSVSAAF